MPSNASWGWDDVGKLRLSSFSFHMAVLRTSVSLCCGSFFSGLQSSPTTGFVHGHLSYLLILVGGRSWAFLQCHLGDFVKLKCVMTKWSNSRQRTRISWRGGDGGLLLNIDIWDLPRPIKSEFLMIEPQLSRWI